MGLMRSADEAQWQRLSAKSKPLGSLMKGAEIASIRLKAEGL